MSAAVLAGLLAGYGVAVPVGAIAALIVSLTSRTSLKVGIGAALGVATADGLYCTAAVLGGAALAHLVEPVAGPMRWVVMVILVGIAVKTAWSALKARGTAATARATSGRMETPVGAYLTFLGLTLLNPATVIYFTALVLGRHSAAEHQVVLGTGRVPRLGELAAGHRVERLAPRPDPDRSERSPGDGSGVQRRHRRAGRLPGGVLATVRR